MLKTLNALSGVKMLSKEAQKKISGGVMQDGTCGAQSPDGGVALMAVSMADAKAYASAHGTHWCCDHCGTATWYTIDPD